MKRLLVILIILAPITCLAQENAVKMTFLGWLTGSSKLSFERALGSDDLPQSGELALSWIGAGMDKFGNDPQGFTVRYGHKLFWLIDYKLRRLEMTINFPTRNFDQTKKRGTGFQPVPLFLKDKFDMSIL